MDNNGCNRLFRKEGNTNYQKLKDFINYSELNTRMAALLLGRFKGRGGVTNGIKTVVLRYITKTMHINL